MTGKILFLGGRPWRAGLDWTAPGPALSVSGIRREAALRGADLVVLRGPADPARRAAPRPAADGLLPSRPRSAAPFPGRRAFSSPSA